MSTASDCLDAPLADTTTIPTDPGPVPRRRSGGPRTPEEKEKSRRNALKHGLRANVLLPDEMAELMEARTAAFSEEFQPDSPYQAWLVEEIARATVQIDRCHELKLADQHRRISRARVPEVWEMDRRSVIEDLGARLKKDPARIARALHESKQGADWLMERWSLLGDILRNVGDWNEAQRRLALDMLGIAGDLREGSNLLPEAGQTEALRALVTRQLTRLHEDRTILLETLDEWQRDKVADGILLVEDATTKRLRLYEAGCRRSLRWAHAEFRRARKTAAAAKEDDASAAESFDDGEMSQSAADDQAARFEARKALGDDLPGMGLMTPPSMSLPPIRVGLIPEPPSAFEEEPGDEGLDLADRTALVPTVAVVPVPAPIAPPSTPTPTPAPAPKPTPTAAPRGRRARRARELQARKAARHAASTV